MTTLTQRLLQGGIKVGELHMWSSSSTTVRRSVCTKQYLLVYSMLGERFPWMLNPEFLQRRAQLAIKGAEYIPLYQQCVDSDFKAAWDAFVEKFDIKS